MPKSMAPLSPYVASSFVCSLPTIRAQACCCLLTLLCATAEKDLSIYLLAFLSKIQTIAGTKIDLAFVNASASTLGMGEVRQSYAVESRRYLPAQPRRSISPTTREKDYDRLGRYAALSPKGLRRFESFSLRFIPRVTIGR